MKKLLLVLLAFLLFPLTAAAVNITVPAAPSAGFHLISTTTGAYVATSTLGAPNVFIGTTASTTLSGDNATSTFQGGISSLGSGGGLASNHGVTITGGNFLLSSGATSTANNGINLSVGCFSVLNTCIGSVSGGVTSLAQSFGTAQTGALTLATSSVAFNGLTVADAITNSGGTFTIVPLWSGTLNNTGLTNSSLTLNAGNQLSGCGAISLGGTCTLALLSSPVFFQASSTLLGATSTIYVGSTATTTLVGNNGTSTFQGGISSLGTGGGLATNHGLTITGGNILSTSAATSTFQNGINLITGVGCFAVNGSCVSGSGGGGAVNSVSNSDGSLTISPTTGSVIGSINPSFGNNFTARQYFSGGLSASSTGPNGIGYYLNDRLFAYGSSTTRSVFIGDGAGGKSATTSASFSVDAVGIGANVGNAANTAFFDATVVGAGTAKLTTNLSHQSFFGFGIASAGDVTGSDNAGFGESVLLQLRAGSKNSAFGHFSLASVNGSSGNSGFGFDSLNSTTGNSNTALGSFASFGGNSGNGNLVIGAGVDLPILSGSNQMNIANVLYASGIFADGTTGNTSSAAVSNSKLGTGTTTPGAKFAIANDSAGTNASFLVSTSTASATSTAFIIDSQGRVGIATSSPGTPFAVKGDSFFDGRATARFIKATTTAVNITSTTITNTAASSTVFTSDTWQSKTFAGNTLRIGDQICIDLRGTYTAPLAANITARLVIGTGSATTTIGQLTTSSLANLANQQFDGNGCITIRSTGASGTVQGNGEVVYSTGTGIVATDYMHGLGTVDTTVAQTVDVTITWDSANVNRSVTFEQASSWVK